MDELRESGASRRTIDEIRYLWDGISSTANPSVTQSSLVELLEKCSSSSSSSSSMNGDGEFWNGLCSTGYVNRILQILLPPATTIATDEHDDDGSHSHFDTRMDPVISMGLLILIAMTAKHVPKLSSSLLRTTTPSLPLFLSHAITPLFPSTTTTSTSTTQKVKWTKRVKLLLADLYGVASTLGMLTTPFTTPDQLDKDMAQIAFHALHSLLTSLPSDSSAARQHDAASMHAPVEGNVLGFVAQHVGGVGRFLALFENDPALLTRLMVDRVKLVQVMECLLRAHPQPWTYTQALCRISARVFSDVHDVDSLRVSASSSVREEVDAWLKVLMNATHNKRVCLELLNRVGDGDDDKQQMQKQKRQRKQAKTKEQTIRTVPLVDQLLAIVELCSTRLTMSLADAPAESAQHGSDLLHTLSLSLCTLINIMESSDKFHAHFEPAEEEEEKGSRDGKLDVLFGLYAALRDQTEQSTRHLTQHPNARPSDATSDPTKPTLSSNNIDMDSILTGPANNSVGGEYFEKSLLACTYFAFLLGRICATNKLNSRRMLSRMSVEDQNSLVVLLESFVAVHQDVEECYADGDGGFRSVEEEEDERHGKGGELVGALKSLLVDLKKLITPCL